MNIAFSALAILILALPGIFLSFAYRLDRGRPVGGGSWSDEIPKGIVLSILLHAIGIGACNLIGRAWTPDKYVDLSAAVSLVAAPAAKDGGITQGVSNAVTGGYNAFWILLYFVILCGGAGAIGFGLRWLVRKYRIDTWHPTLYFLRWNDWFYLLNGESPEGNQIAESGENTLLAVSAVVGEWLYKGYLEDYFVKSDGQLDSIVLYLPERRTRSDEQVVYDAAGHLISKTHNPYYPITADYLVLKFEDMENLAVTLVTLEDPDDPDVHDLEEDEPEEGSNDNPPLSSPNEPTDGPAPEQSKLPLESDRVGHS